jgi:hypothetical protein
VVATPSFEVERLIEDELKPAEPEPGHAAAPAAAPAEAPGASTPADEVPEGAISEERTRADAIVFPVSVEEPAEDHGEAIGAGPEPEAEEEVTLHCVLCGSTSLHESDHVSLATITARAVGATVYTCDDCRHRFTVRLLKRIHRRRRHHRDSQRERDRRIRSRRRLFYWFWLMLGASLSALVVYYFLERDRQRSLTPPDGGVFP